MRILLSGSNGLIGRSVLLSLKAQGHEVVRLVRDKETEGVYWNPQEGSFAASSFERFDAVIHLAGDNIAGRWTRRKKERLFLSRCRDSRLLAKILLSLSHPPKVVIAASAIGFYGDREEVLTEASRKGEGFLPDLCEGWEDALQVLGKRQIRVVHMRFGPVLSGSGGMLRKLILPFKLGLGGRMGSGKQIISWIHIEDAVGAMEHSLMTDILSGPVNATSPSPVPQIDFARALAHQLHRPLLMPMPAFLLRIIYGQMADELLLASACVKPEKLLRTGYVFHYPDLEAALRACI